MSEVATTAPRARQALWIALLLVSAVVVLLRGASDTEGEAGIVDLAGTVMGTDWHVRAVAPRGDAERLREAVQGALDDVDRRFSTYKRESLLMRFNAHHSAEPFAADAELASVLRTALRIAEASGGAYDPTIFPVVALWGFAGGERREPTETQLAEAMAHVGWKHLSVDPDGHLLKQDPLLAIDLSSIAKGYGVDRASAALVAAGCAAHMVEVGGEVVCRGAKPDESPWQIGIERPHPDEAEDDKPIQEVIGLRDRAVATSGSYRNWFEAGGKRRHHIVDARTGRNAASAVVSVSVTADDCTLADGLATALMVVGPEHARDLLRVFAPARIGVLFLVEDKGTIREVPVDWPFASQAK
ncbi:MAG: FAD:protein FMN transferase [Planctomycetota bacterium]